MKRGIIIIFALLAFVLMLVPYETIHVPAWQVRVVDQYGNPVVGTDVGQTCENYTLDLSSCSDARDRAAATDGDGMVAFPERRIRMNLILRLARSAKSYLFWIAHGSVGSDIYLQATSAEGVKRLSLESGKPPPTEFVVPVKNDLDYGR